MGRSLIKDMLKTALNRLFLPAVYNVYRNKPLETKKVIFADSNSETLPDSMQLMYDKLCKEGYDVRLWLSDFRKTGLFGMMKFMVGFMKDYATARCVFVCNYFVPVTSCKKRSETDVVQLWHSCGLLKKFAYDSKEDISPHYHGSVTKNITLITVSSEACVPVWQNALKLTGRNRGIVKATGVSRTDRFFDEDFKNQCKEEFYEKYPHWRKKKILLWAPTFRGTAANPVLKGEKGIADLEKRLGGEWAVVIKLHPHMKEKLTNCDMPTYKLFACADLLVSDYSSLIFEFALFGKPIVIYAPDYEEYRGKRGFYIDPEEISGKVARNPEELYQAVKSCTELSGEEKAARERLIEKHCGACDGRSTDRIAQMIFSKK